VDVDLSLLKGLRSRSRQKQVVKDKGYASIVSLARETMDGSSNVLVLDLPKAMVAFIAAFPNTDHGEELENAFATNSTRKELLRSVREVLAARRELGLKRIWLYSISDDVSYVCYL